MWLPPETPSRTSWQFMLKVGSITLLSHNALSTSVAEELIVGTRSLSILQHAHPTLGRKRTSSTSRILRVAGSVISGSFTPANACSVRFWLLRETLLPLACIRRRV